MNMLNFNFERKCTFKQVYERDMLLDGSCWQSANSQ